MGILLTRRARPRGLGPATLFVLLAALTALSIDWSVAPGESWIEANRTLSYLAVFLGAVALGNIAPAAGQVVLRGILIAAAAVIAYALASRVWPAELAELEIYARIGQPFGYWNAVGVTAALAFPLALWLGARRHGGAAVSALAYPLAGLLTVALFLTYSRSATLAAIVVVVIWIVFVPLRLRSALVVIAGAAGAAPVILWATSRAAFTDDGVDLAVREEAATTFGLMLLGSTVLLYAVGLAIITLRRRTALEADSRRRMGRLLVAVAAAGALVGVGAVAASDRGLGGTLADRWDELRNETAPTTGGPDRLSSAASTRGRYWRQAKDVWEERPLTGAGAGGYTLASLRFRDDSFISRHAHGYAPQTLADLGLIGLAISLALAFSWLVAARRAVDRAPPGQAREWTADRTAVAALSLAAVAYGIQSTLDWTWFVPGPTVMALLAAGFVAGRGPAADAAEAPASGRPSGLRIALAVAAVLAALSASWSIWQPERADRLAGDALALSGQGELDLALDRARAAQEIDPLALRPVFAEAAVHHRAGRERDALEVFRRAASEHPDDPQAWLRLADFQLYELSDEEGALAALDQALYLDPMSLSARDSFFEARARLRAEGVLPEKPPAP